MPMPTGPAYRPALLPLVLFTAGAGVGSILSQPGPLRPGDLGALAVSVLLAVVSGAALMRSETAPGPTDAGQS